MREHECPAIGREVVLEWGDTPDVRLARQERRPPDWDYDARPLGHPTNRPPEDIAADYLRQTERGKRGLNLGCGGYTFKGWLNIDYDQPWHLDIQYDLSSGAPFLPEGQFDAIFSEAFFEHIGRKEAQKLLSDCLLSLRRGGRIRLALPSLDNAFHLYRVRAERLDMHQDIRDHFGSVLGTPAEAFNLAIRGWGHQYMYDEEEIFALLEHVGFTNVKRCKIRVSDFPLLHNRECRPSGESDLIVEASKP